MIAACLCFRDSADLLHEWLLFHSVQGVNRFYLYDNGSVDDYTTVLAPWMATGRVQLALWPGLAQQQAIYDHCLRRATRDGVQWLAFIDDDEFLFATDGTSLPTALAPYFQHAGVAVPWLLFGSSGREPRSERWVIETFTRRATNPDSHVKCIVQPGAVVRSRVIGHAFEPVTGFEIVDEKFQPIREAQTIAPSIERFRIHHYLIKSWEEFSPRRLRPQADTGAPKAFSLEQWREWDAWWSETEDASARRFVPAMKTFEATLLT